MARRFLLFGLIVLLAITIPISKNVHATTDDTWAKLYHHPWTEWWKGSEALDFIPTQDGGYAVVGKMQGDHSFVLKLDTTGSVGWSHIFSPGSQGNVALTSIIQLKDGGYAVAGQAEAEGGSGASDALVVRLNADGSIRWQKLYGRVQNQGQANPTSEYTQRIYENSDATLTLAGVIHTRTIGACPYSYHGGLIIELNQDGTLRSQFVFAGDSGDPQTYKTRDGGYMVSFTPWLGSFYSVNLQKYQANGKLAWSKAYHYTIPAGANTTLGRGTVAEVADGYIVNASDGYRLYLFKINSAGAVQWQKKFKIYSDYGSVFQDQVVSTTDGGALVTISNGYTTIGKVALKIKPNGSLDWATFYGGRDLRKLQPLPTGGFLTAISGYDLVVARLDTEGLLKEACTQLNPAAHPVVQETFTDLFTIAGTQPTSCTATVSQGTWTSADVNLLLSDQHYRQVNSCAPKIDFRPEALDFGTGKIGETSSPRTISVSNYNGLTALTIDQVVLEDPLHFSVQNDGCSGKTIYPVNFGPSGSSTGCDIQVVFHPRSKGMKQAQLRIVGKTAQAEVLLKGYLAQDLEIAGPGQVSPGQIADYAVRYHNPADSNLSGAVLVLMLPFSAEYVSSTEGGIYWPERHQVFWKLGTLAPYTVGTLAAQLRYRWGIPEGTEENVIALLSGDGVGVLDVAPYLAYTPPTVTASTALTAAEFATELNRSPELKRRYDEALAQGFTAGTPTRLTLNQGDPLLQVILIHPLQKTVLFLYRQGNEVLVQRIGGGSYSVGNDTGGFTVDLSTGATQPWDATIGSGMLAETGISKSACMFNCALTKAALFVPGAVNDAIGALMDSVDCVACARGDEAACVKCTTGVAKVAGKIGSKTAIPIGLAADAFSCNQTCSDPGKRDSYVCQGELKTCAGVEVGWFGRRRATVRTWSCGPNGMWQLLPTYSYCEAWESCVPGRRPDPCAGCLEGQVQLAENTDDNLCADQQAAGGACGLRPTIVRVARDPNAKAGPAGNLLPGQTISYTISYENEGSGTAYGVYILDELSEHLDASSLQLGANARYIPASRTILWDIGELAPKGQPGSSGTVSFSVQVKQGLPGGTPIINLATVYFPSVPEQTLTNAVVNQVHPVVALPTALVTERDTPVSVPLRGMDTGASALTFVVDEPPRYGQLSGNAPNVTYTPMAGFNGIDEFTFKVNNGTSTSEPALVQIRVGPFTARSGSAYLPLVVRAR